MAKQRTITALINIIILNITWCLCAGCSILESKLFTRGKMVSYSIATDPEKKQNIPTGWFMNQNTYFEEPLKIFLNNNGTAYIPTGPDKEEWGIYVSDGKTIKIDMYQEDPGWSLGYCITRYAFDIVDSCTIRRKGTDDYARMSEPVDWRMQSNNNVFLLCDTISNKEPGPIPEKYLKWMK